MTLRTLAGLAAATLVAFSAAAETATDPPSSPIVQERVWNLDMDVVAVGPDTAGSLAKFTVSATSKQPGTHDTPVAGAGSWPGGSLRVTVMIERLTGDEAHVEFVSELTRPGRSPVRASRRLALREGASELIEVFGEGERRLLVSMRGEEGTRPVLRRLASAGARVLFHVGIERVDGERVVPLETNDLNTFVGEPVEYSFDFGGDGERLRLVLTPVSITGSLVQVRAQVSGRLPDASGPVVLSRDQLLAASRDATSSIEVVAGAPPRGYRFRITPEF